MKAGKQTQAQYPSFDVYDCSIISLILWVKSSEF